VDGARRDQPGGRASLLELLRGHGEAIEADLQHHYGVDLRDIGTPALTWRRLRVLIQHLPADSSLSKAMNGEAAEWGTAEYLLANVCDGVAALVWQGGNPKKNPKPKPLQRPGDRRSKRKRQVPLDEMRRRLIDLRERERARKQEVADGD